MSAGKVKKIGSVKELLEKDRIASVCLQLGKNWFAPTYLNNEVYYLFFEFL